MRRAHLLAYQHGPPGRNGSQFPRRINSRIDHIDPADRHGRRRLVLLSSQNIAS